MHYGNWDFSSNDEMTLQAINDPKRILGQRDGFSQTDVNQLNKVYKCKGYENVKVPPLKGKICFLNWLFFTTVFLQSLYQAILNHAFV